MATRTTTTTYHRSRASPASLSAAAALMLLASIFWWIVAFSVPFIKHVYWIKTPSDNLKLGTFGWCAVGDTICYKHVGYNWRPEIIDHTHLTGSFILIPIVAFFSSLAFFSLLHSIRDLRSGFLSFVLTLFVAFLSTLTFLLGIICFAVAHHRFKKEDLQPHYGAALPLFILGWLFYLTCVPLVIIGWFRERHYRRQNEEAAMASVQPYPPPAKRGFFSKRG